MSPTSIPEVSWNQTIGNAVPAAQGDELVHLDQALAVELAADAGIVGVFGIVLAQVTLSVADAAHQKPVDLAQAGIDLGTVVRPEFHVLAAVHQPGEDLLDLVHLFLVEGHQAVEVFAAENGRRLGSATRKNLGA
jgi:hypothetical protein